MKLFRRRPELVKGVNITDNILVIEGGLPDWRHRDEEAEAAHYAAMKAKFGKAFTDSAVDLPGCELEPPPLQDAFATPTTTTAPTEPAPEIRTVRRFRPKPRVVTEEGEVVMHFTVRGGLPDWRHYEENRAIARAEYAEKQVANNIAPTIAQPEAPSEYLSAKNGEPSPAETLTIEQLLDPNTAFNSAPKTE
jgi:hypothetical protein